MILYNRKTLRFNFPVKQLKQLLRAKPQYGSNQAGIDRNSIHEARYIRITDIDEYGLLKNNLGVTAKFIEEKYIIKNNDLLFARSGATVGKAYLHTTDSVNYECFYAGYMIRFLVNENLLLSKFLFCYTQLEVYKEWVKAIQRAAAQPNINAEEYKSLSIPIPSLEIQNTIISIFEAAYDSKQRKEVEAAELLASIDNYLLEQLGITLPPQTEKKTSFITDFNKLSGGRFDPFYHQNYFQQAEKAISSAIYSCIKFRDVIKQLKTGTTPHQNLNPFDNQGIMFLRNTNLKPYEFDLSEIRFIKQEYKNLLTFSYRDEVIICIAGTVGTSAVNKLNEPIAINQNITSIKINKDLIDSNFLVAYLNSKLAIELTKRICSVATIFYLNNENLKNLQIPLPPLEKQEAIAAHINEIRAKAKHLQHQAAETLEQAKQHVEKMILG